MAMVRGLIWRPTCIGICTYMLCLDMHACMHALGGGDFGVVFWNGAVRVSRAGKWAPNRIGRRGRIGEAAV
jgi:hypothetical protein